MSQHLSYEYGDGRKGLALESRAEVLAELATGNFDVLIIGGGITGCGAAREASLRGYRTALLERDDFASGTSSRTSRLVHGGVRYLEHGHLSLVFESSRERRILLELAPHLVQPLAFTWPVYSGARLPKWKLRAGLSLYDILSLYRNSGRHEGLDKNGILDAEPALLPDGLKGGARYWDAATDDSRLTLAAALAAKENGAAVANHMEVTGEISNRGRLKGVIARDKLSGNEITVHAGMIINCTGPWSDATAAITGIPETHAILGSAGSHIAVPRNRIGNRDAITLISPLDERVMFVLPSGVHSIIGTTERKAPQGPDSIRATDQDVNYLLNSVNRVFPHAQLNQADIVAAWAGIRPLAASKASSGSNAGSASREHSIFRESNGLISVTGGKLTTWRAMSVDIIDTATGEKQSRQARAKSESQVLPGGDIVSLESTEHEVLAATADSPVSERLSHAYGSRWRNVWSYAQRDPELRKRIVPDLPYIQAEILHAIERELACDLADILVRRTHIAYETKDNGRLAAERIAPLVASFLNWDKERQERELASYRQEADRLFSIDSAM